MSILSRYLWKNILLSIFMTWVSLVLLDAFFGFMNELGDVDSKTRYGTLQALIYIVYTLPRRFYDFFPTATLIGSLLGLGNLAAHSELIAIRAAGISISKIATSILTLGLLMALLIFSIGEWGVPNTELAAREFKVEMRKNNVSLTGKSVWLKQDNQIIHIAKVWNSREFADISIFQINPDKGQLEKVIKIDSAQQQNDNQWVLKKITERNIREDRNGIDIKHIEQKQQKNFIPSSVIDVASVKPEHLSAEELSRFIEHQRKNNLQTQRFELAFWTRFSTPLSTLVMLIVALPFVFNFQRNAGAGQRLFIGILVGIVFFIFNRMMNNLGLVYGYPPILSAFTPLVLFLFIGLYFIRRVR